MQNQLATMYLTGRGVSRDEREAFRWYSEAARNFNEYADLALAELYAEGKGVDKDFVEALAHVEIALEVLGSNTHLLDKARALKVQMLLRLSPAEIERARVKAHKLRPDIMRK